MSDSSQNADIETGADTLLSFLEEKSKWPVSKIANEMGVPKKTVKNWAKALEKSGLVEIKYSALRGMVLEYASEESYEELNEGRSELALEADEIDIEVDEVEEVEESSDGEEASEKQEDNKEVENNDIAEPDEEDSEKIDGDRDNSENDTNEGDKPKEEDTEDESIDEDEETEIDEEFEKATLNETKGEKSDQSSIGSSNNELDKDPESMTQKEGKEKLKEELENLDRNKREKTEKAMLKAKKAKITKTSKENKDETSELEGVEEIEEKEDHEAILDRLHNHVSSGSELSVDHTSGSNFEENIENIEELGYLLTDNEVDNNTVYSRIEQEMSALKETLKEEEITDDMKNDVYEAMTVLEGNIENVEEEKGFFARLIAKLKGVLQ